jgi:acyl dehydratase
MKRVFEDLSVGETFRSSRRTVTEADIMAFAGVSGDFNPLHTDEEWVRQNTDFTGRIAHGALLLAISTGLRTPELDDLQIVAFLELSRQMVAPTYPGDTVSTVQRVSATKPSRSRPGAGIVTFEVTMQKTDGTVVQRGSDVYLIAGPAVSDDTSN